MTNQRHPIEGDVPTPVWEALQAEQERTGESMSTVIERSLGLTLGLAGHSMYQVSTTSALVKGVFGGAVTVADLSTHGDFGIGTFDRLDGELVMLEGICYHVGGGGAVSVAPPDRTVPFAVLAWFEADSTASIADVDSLAGLEHALNAERPSENAFAGIRVDGRFESLSLRAACAAAPGENLVEATAHQSEFMEGGVNGTLVGFWAPTYGRSVNVPGYHFHFLSNDRTIGGHVLDVSGASMFASLHIETDIHLALPETAEFLEADLGGDPSHDLSVAEGSTAQEPDEA